MLVIADQAVAKQYSKLLRQMDVSISESKSLCSSNSSLDSVSSEDAGRSLSSG